MNSLFFSANNLKMHPFFAGDDFETFKLLVRPLILSRLDGMSVKTDELYNLLHNRSANLRETRPAHFTTSSVVLSPDRRQFLLLFHKKINEWVYPGGHADGDWHLLRSALRECFEETGLSEVEVMPPCAFAETPEAARCPHLIERFEIQATAHEPSHIHYDAVFLFRADTRVVHFEELESSDYQWMDVPVLKAHAQRPLGQLRDGFDPLTARVCLAAMRSALGTV